MVRGCGCTFIDIDTSNIGVYSGNIGFPLPAIILPCCGNMSQYRIGHITTVSLTEYISDGRTLCTYVITGCDMLILNVFLTRPLQLLYAYK